MYQTTIGVAREPGPPSIEMLPMIKMLQKGYCFFGVSFFQHLRLQQYKRTTAIKNNIGPEGPGPLNLIFTNQFKQALYNNI